MKKILLGSALMMLLFTLMIPSKIRAQSLTLDDIKAQLVKDWERAKNYTVLYLNTMPADKYSFMPVDSVKRSFAQQMLHLAQANLFLMSKASPLSPPAFIAADLDHSATAQTKDSVMYYVTTSYDYCINAVKTSNVAKWEQVQDVFGFKETRFALILKTFEHQTHHRGQATIYIRLQGIKPPQENLF
jgi:uncharacterized damage-inducible protein DinB